MKTAGASWICALLVSLATGCGDDGDAGSGGPDDGEGGTSSGGESSTSSSASTSSTSSTSSGSAAGGGGSGDDFDLPAPAVTWTPCDLAGAVDVECADVPVPLDWSDVDGPTMTVRAYRRLAATDAPRGSLTFLDGGPGSSGGIEPFAQRLTTSRHPDLDLMSLDHRGTGASGPLQCAEPTDPPDDACLASLLAQDPGRIAATTTSASALDAVAIAHWFGRGTTRLLYGWSYGTYWAHRAVSLAPNAFDGLVLDSPCDAVTGCPSSRRDAGMDVVNRRILALCDEDETCRARLSIGTLELAERVVAAADEATCQRAEDAGLDGSRVRQTLSHLAGDAPFLLPAFLLRYERCGAEDAEVFAAVAEALDFVGDILTYVPSFSLPTNYHVSRTEFWDPSVTVAEAEAAFSETLAASGASVRWAERFEDWPWPVPPVDDALHAWHVDTVPTLVLVGELDTATPPMLVAALPAALGPGSSLIELPFAQHVESLAPSPAGRCGAALVDAFVDDPGAPLDTTCVAASAEEQRGALFAQNDEVTAFWFGTTSMYGD